MKKSSSTIHVRWVRSGIGFTRRQREMIRGLGLRHLGQVRELEDTPCVRGLLSAVRHLVEVVKPPARSAWKSIPEYRIVSIPPVASPASVAATESAARPVAHTAQEEVPVSLSPGVPERTEAAGQASPSLEEETKPANLDSAEQEAPVDSPESKE